MSALITRINVHLFLFYHLASSNQYLSSSTAFIFSLVNKPGWGPVTFRPPGKYYSYQHATYDYFAYGPTFGSGHDIYIASYASSNTISYTNLGHAYSPPTGHSYGDSFTRSFLAGSYTFQPDEVEVFYESTWKKDKMDYGILSNFRLGNVMLNGFALCNNYVSDSC